MLKRSRIRPSGRLLTMQDAYWSVRPNACPVKHQANRGPLPSPTGAIAGRHPQRPPNLRDVDASGARRPHASPVNTDCNAYSVEE
jgi:hypothetical protein